jgi:hypothetical protein
VEAVVREGKAVSATAKTLGSLGVALLGLIAYTGVFLGCAVFKIGFFGLALYLGLALTVVLFVVILLTTTASDVEETEG